MLFITGRIHSIESMGLVDGPGIRTVVFLQGCALRCSFCHNPDTWSVESGKEITPDALLQKLIRFRPYFQKSRGGVTFSGGEPLLQPDFLLEALKLCKQEGIHTCVDTAGVGLGQYEELLAYTDLVLYDIKHYEPDPYQEITGNSIEKTNEFLKALEKSQTPLWIRQVVVPGITDSHSYMKGLQNYLANIPQIEKVELLPYHLMGVNKYQTLRIQYPLTGVPRMEPAAAEQLQNEYFSQWRTNK